MALNHKPLSPSNIAKTKCDMKKTILMAVFALATIALPAIAQDKHKAPRDPKMMSAKMAEKLSFTDAQQQQLEALNKKYPGADFDRQQYRQEFRAIMTDAQKKQADEMKAKMRERKNSADK